MSRAQQSGHALGSECTLTIITDESNTSELFQRLWTTIHAFEARFSRFQPTSELTTVNQTAGKPTKISKDFYKLSKAALDLNERTHGLYNPLILPALQQAGYTGSWPTPTVFDDKLNYASRHISQASNIKLTERLIALPADSALDFGGIGKGYLLDMLADILDTQHVKDYWLSLGGDIVTRGHNLEEQPWRIGIANTFSQDEVVSFAENLDGSRMAIATSGTAKRKGPGWHHIIDPRTGKPAETDTITATVIAPTGTLADVYAKCLVIVGSEAAADFAQLHGITEYVMQLVDETIINTLH